MLCNVSFGILVFDPLGWGLMLLVVAMEALLLSRRLPPASLKSCFHLSLLTNAASGLVGFIVSMLVTGGWWLVVWVPWVTAREASREQWPDLAAFMGVAYAGSVIIESGMTLWRVRGVKLSRILGAQALLNLISSIVLLTTFWLIGGVPGYGPS